MPQPPPLCRTCGKREWNHVCIQPTPRGRSREDIAVAVLAVSSPRAGSSHRSDAPSVEGASRSHAASSASAPRRSDRKKRTPTGSAAPVDHPSSADRNAAGGGGTSWLAPPGKCPSCDRRRAAGVEANRRKRRAKEKTDG